MQQISRFFHAHLYEKILRTDLINALEKAGQIAAVQPDVRRKFGDRQAFFMVLIEDVQPRAEGVFFLQSDVNVLSLQAGRLQFGEKGVQDAGDGRGLVLSLLTARNSALNL